MNSEQLFTLALGIQSPWYVREISMKPQTGAIGELHIYLDFKPGSLFQAASMDKSPSFISGAMSSFTDAAITFDKFHVVKEVNNAMDELRRLEAKKVEDLKGTKYTFLNNDKN